MMADVLMIAHFCDGNSSDGNNRFNYIAALLSRNNDVELVTSGFSHRTKAQRMPDGDNGAYKVTMIKEPEYKKNVSLRRFYSHFVMGRHLQSYLKERKKPDVIYCAYPSIDAAYAAAKYAEREGIRFILDVQDLWPEAFRMVFNLPLVSGLLYRPMEKRAEYIYGAADELLAVSQTYVDRAMTANKKAAHGKSVFLGTDLAKFDALAGDNNVLKPADEIWIAYVGMLGHSYDLMTVMDAIQILSEKYKIKKIRFIVMGDGPLRDRFERAAEEKRVDAIFTGRLAYGCMAGMLCACDIAVNPIARGAAQSIINKVGDYAAAGLPVVSTQECVEYRDMVEWYQIGYNCENGDAGDVAEKMLLLIRDPRVREVMGANNRRLAELKFDRRKTYEAILSTVGGIDEAD